MRRMRAEYRSDVSPGGEHPRGGGLWASDQSAYGVPGGVPAFALRARWRIARRSLRGARARGGGTLFDRREGLRGGGGDGGRDQGRAARGGGGGGWGGRRGGGARRREREGGG